MRFLKSIAGTCALAALFCGFCAAPVQGWEYVSFPNRVIIPYAQHGSDWFTGLAITNCNTVNATRRISILCILPGSGDYFDLLDSVNIGTLNPGEQIAGTIEDFLGKPPSSERFWIAVTHSKGEEIAVTQFIWNSENSFDFKSYNSRMYSSPVHVPISMGSPDFDDDVVF